MKLEQMVVFMGAPCGEFRIRLDRTEMIVDDIRVITEETLK